MPIPAQRIIKPEQIRNFGRIGETIDVPPLTDVQLRSYERFLQLDMPPEKRTPTGLEGVLREIFPIESYDKTINLAYLKYELGKPRYDADECRQLRLTYGRPFRVWLRLNKEQPGRGRSLPGRHADHDRRRRIHHQRRRARRRQPAAPLPWRRFRRRNRSRRQATSQLPHHSRTR